MYRRLLIQTRLTPDAAEDRLAKLIRPRESLFHGLNNPDPAHDLTRPFVGSIDDGRFKFHLVLTHRNSFVPIVTGRILQGEAGAVLHGAMRMAIPVAVFMAVWMTGAVFAAVDLIPRGLRTSSLSDVVFGLLFPLFGVILVSVGFFPDVRRTRRILEEAFRSANLA